VYPIGTQDIISQNNFLFATNDNKIIKSTNNGVTWIKVYEDVVNSGKFSFGQLASNGSKLFVIRWSNPDNKLLSSSNDGQTWVEVSMFPFHNANILYSAGSKLIVGTSQNGIYVSTNDGANWTVALPANINVSVNGFTILNSDIYCATTGGIYKSTNNGSNWFQSGLSNNVCYTIAACNQNLTVSVDSSSNKKIGVSTNYGSTWITYPFQIYGMYSMTSIGSTLYMASFSDIYKSTNGGFNWSTLPLIPNNNINWVGAVGTRLFVGNNSSNISYSDNEGLNWETKYVNMNKSNSLVQLNNNIFAGTSNGVFISPSSSQSWTQTSLNHTEVFSVAVSDGRIFAGTKDYGIYYSDNNGSSWTQSSLTNKSVLSFVTVGNKIFAGTISNGIYTSTDNGINWTQSSLNNQTVNCLMSANSNLYCGTENNGIFMSTNTGSTWTQTSFNNKTVYALHNDGTSTRLYAGTLNSGFYVSIDSGKGWNSFGLQGKTVRAFVSWSFHMFCVVDGNGFYVSSNYGLSWVLKNSGELNGVNFYPSSMIIANNSMVYISTFKTSVWQNAANLVSIQQITSVTPEKFILFQNYPNPFNPNTKIKFDLKETSDVTLEIYNSAGKEIQTIVDKKLSSGSYEVNWNASDFPSGVYYYKIVAENFTETKKMMLIK
jgi:hypothetical protein